MGVAEIGWGGTRDKGLWGSYIWDVWLMDYSGEQQACRYRDKPVQCTGEKRLGKAEQPPVPLIDGERTVTPLKGRRPSAKNHPKEFFWRLY